MRVCHFIASRGLGRGEFYIDLANELCKTIEISLVIPRDAKYLNRVDPRVNIIEYKAVNTRRNPLLLIELFRIFKKLQPDLVHTHFDMATEIFSFLNRFLKIEFVGTKHNPRKGRIFNRIKNVIAVSKAVEKSIKQQDVKIIYNGLIPETVSSREPLQDIFTICSVGRLEQVKGYDILINEVAKLDFNFKLQIVGEGPERANLERLIEQKKLSNKVFLLGFRKDIPQLMGASHLVVVSSRSEGFSIVLLEGIFYADLVISTDVGIASEIFTDEFIIPGFDIAAKINDIHSRYNYFCQEFGMLKEKVQENFLLSNIASQYIDYYRELIGTDR
jgi:glycosyltransferase involved in cell wall biosynthesis